tara:strand:- start:81050 stop:81160 length:111 start_codon:yes stop_codon:yes gene_type:complete
MRLDDHVSKGIEGQKFFPLVFNSASSGAGDGTALSP